MCSNWFSSTLWDSALICELCKTRKTVTSNHSRVSRKCTKGVLNLNFYCEHGENTLRTLFHLYHKHHPKIILKLVTFTKPFKENASSRRSFSSGMCMVSEGSGVSLIPMPVVHGDTNTLLREIKFCFPLLVPVFSITIVLNMATSLNAKCLLRFAIVNQHSLYKFIICYI